MLAKSMDSDVLHQWNQVCFDAISLNDLSKLGCDADFNAPKLYSHIDR